jgi:multidrug efflux system membrane fusion protein
MDDIPRTKVAEYAPERRLRDKAAPRRTRKRSLGRRLLTLIVLGAVAFGAYKLIRMYETAAPKGQTGRGQHSGQQAVGAATIGTGNIRIVLNALGTVTPVATVTVTTQINGQLTEVGFKEGQHVKKGDFLAQIDPRPYQAAEEQAEGQLRHDQGLLDQAQMDNTRYQNLAKTQAIPRQQSEDQVFIVKQYEGTVKSDQAQVDTQKLNLVYCRIVSPIDGRVGLRLVDPGNYVQTTNTTGIAVITQMQPMTIIFPVPEDDLPQITEQMRAGKTLEVAAYDRANVTKIATGKVAALDSQIDPTTGTVKLRAEFENTDEKLFPNQFVNARLLVTELRDVVTVPVAAVQRGAPGTYVYLINADDTVSVRPIKLGPTDGEMTQVVSGLSAGDRVVVDGTDRLRDGAKVVIPGSAGQGPAAGADQPSGQGRQNPKPDGAQGEHHHHRDGQESGQSPSPDAGQHEHHHHRDAQQSAPEQQNAH